MNGECENLAAMSDGEDGRKNPQNVLMVSELPREHKWSQRSLGHHTY